MLKIILPSALLSLAGCSTLENTRHYSNDSDAPRLPPSVVRYEPGMSIPVNKPHIDSKGNINSMYDPVVHCHTLYHPGQPPQKVCRIVR
jgi:hypothetical protein